MHNKGWDPDAVAPPMRGGVYEREAPYNPAKRSWIIIGVAVFITLLGVRLCGGA